MKSISAYPSSMYHEKNEKYIYRHPIIPNISFFNALKLMSLGFRNTFAVDCLNLEVTYQELIDDAIMISKAFSELGVKKGDIISISLTNIYHAVVSFCAANKIGAVVAFLNPQSTIEQEINYLNTFESPLFIHFEKGEEYSNKIIGNTKVKNIISLKLDDIENRNFDSKKNNGYQDVVSFNELRSIALYKKGKNCIKTNGKNDALILFTSGTTGIPKNVVITNENILASGIYMKNSCHLSSGKGLASLVCVPFSYPYGFCTSTLMSLLSGMKVILAPTLNNENIKEYYAKNPTYVFGSPAFLELTKRNIPKAQDLSHTKVFISGGDFLFDKEIEEGKQFFENHNSKIEICNGSGNAESVGASTNSVGIPYKAGTVGKVLTGTHPIILDLDNWKELPYGVEGELCISGKHIFRGYYKEPQLTEEIKFIYNGRQYIHTGMMGILDNEGYFTITGRSSRFYINGDLNKIYLERVQNVISLIDGVESCIAVPKPDDMRLFVCKVYIVPVKKVINEDKFKSYLKEQFLKPMRDINGEEVQLKSYEIPESIDLIENLPRNEEKGGKIDISLLEKMAREEYEMQKLKKETNIKE